MRIYNTSGELTEWVGHHHAPMHEDGGVDEIDISSLTGTKAVSFMANVFQYPAPATEWWARWFGAYLGPGLTSDKLFLPLNFLKIGDIITGYTVYVLITEAGGDTVTLDCKLIRVNPGAPPTKTDITNGAITQLARDGYTETAVDNDDETVATGKFYALEITGTTSNVSGTEVIEVFGAKIDITRIM